MEFGGGRMYLSRLGPLNTVDRFGQIGTRSGLRSTRASVMIKHIRQGMVPILKQVPVPNLKIYEAYGLDRIRTKISMLLRNFPKSVKSLSVQS